jgi:Xaa-Pro aminopeptidase
MTDCQVRDGAALIQYLHWIQTQLEAGRTDLNEWDAGLRLAEFRSEGAHFVGLSFETISAVGGNAAVIHYAPEKTGSSALRTDAVYLCDSGAQYLDGTTDTTRTVHYGTPTAREKECYTRVLKGNLDVQMAVWPTRTRLTGSDLDILARKPLWEVGLDYNHGTGHGVGYYLNCHEGPHHLGGGTDIPYIPGMNVTVEPGYYEKDFFGIRIEDLVFVETHPTHAEHLCFKNVTLAPYDRNLIDNGLLSQQ